MSAVILIKLLKYSIRSPVCYLLHHRHLYSTVHFHAISTVLLWRTVRLYVTRTYTYTSVVSSNSIGFPTKRNKIKQKAYLLIDYVDIVAKGYTLYS